jgi:uncharacterized protein (TIRG00374 family)
LNYQRNENSVSFRIRFWLLGLLTLSGLILMVSHIGELEHFAALVRRAEPGWLVLALVLQVLTYACVAAVWYLPLRHVGLRQSFWSLIPLGVAKLFADQSMPSGGMSGTAFFIAALNRRGIPNEMCMATLLLSMVAFYGTYVLAAVIALSLLYFHHALDVWIVLFALLFSLVAVGIPSGAFWLRSIKDKRRWDFVMRIPGLSSLMQWIANAPGALLRSPSLILATAFFHGMVFLLDAATLWVMMHVVGAPISFWIAFPSFMFASMVATIGPIPLGLGTFEVTCVTLLGVMGVPIEAALGATILLRGFTVWLPMLPGMWLARWALR